jgi:outer membrane protein
VGDPKLDPSWGIVGQVGVDYDIGNNWFLNADLKYMKIKTTAKFTSGALGDVSTDVTIDPWVLGFGIGKRF